MGCAGVWLCNSFFDIWFTGPTKVSVVLNISGVTPSSNPELYSVMVAAKNISPPMTKVQIENKTKDQLEEMWKQLTTKNRLLSGNSSTSIPYFQGEDEC